MQVLYCSTLASYKTLDSLSKDKSYPLTSITVQKFHRLIAHGLLKNGSNVTALSTPPTSGHIRNNQRNDEEAGVVYNYIPTIEIPVIRHICIVLYSFIKTIQWSLKHRKEEHIIICDVLNISLSIGVIMSSLFGVKAVGLMTDMPGLMVTGIGRKGILSNLIRDINLFFLHRYSAYIFLTEAMNTAINHRNRPYIVMEGLVDVEMDQSQRNPERGTRNILYAGGIYEKYGVKMLIEAFRKVKGENLRLFIYGDGPMKADMAKYEQMDSRFCYKGIAPNPEVVKEELKATLLVNPRPTTEEFTKFSFPSKNMEYMVSGTPVLSMALSGMPDEYYDKIFVCYDETVDGLALKLSEILSLSDEELFKKGEIARNFVLHCKNNTFQARRIITLFNVCLKNKI